ncbi:YncE family protein [Mycobacterium sp. C31M]
MINVENPHNPYLEPGQIMVGYTPTDIAFSPDGKYAYVLNGIDDGYNRIILGVNPYGPGRRMGVTIIRTSDRAVIKTVAVDDSGDASRFALSPDGSTLYVAGYGQANTRLISVIDIPEDPESAMLRTGTRLDNDVDYGFDVVIEALVFSADNSVVYGLSGRQLYAIDAATCTIISSVELPVAVQPSDIRVIGNQPVLSTTTNGDVVEVDIITL